MHHVLRPPTMRRFILDDTLAPIASRPYWNFWLATPGPCIVGGTDADTAKVGRIIPVPFAKVPIFLAK